MIIKMVNKFKLTIVHVAHPNPMQICACEGFNAGQKTVKNQDQDEGRWAVAGCGPAFSKTPNN